MTIIKKQIISNPIIYFMLYPSITIRYIWWAILGSNQGPAGYEPDALTTELMAHVCYSILKIVVGVAGFEPAAHWSQTSCATKLRYTPKVLTCLQ